MSMESYPLKAAIFALGTSAMHLVTKNVQEATRQKGNGLLYTFPTATVLESLIFAEKCLSSIARLKRHGLPMFKYLVKML